jgi:hypothetical protein
MKQNIPSAPDTSYMSLLVIATLHYPDLVLLTHLTSSLSPALNLMLWETSWQSLTIANGHDNDTAMPRMLSLGTPNFQSTRFYVEAKKTVPHGCLGCKPALTASPL